MVWVNAVPLATFDVPSSANYVGDHCAAKWLMLDS